MGGQDLGWMAGLMDGEGCISLYQRNRYGKGWDYFVQISNTNPAIIKKSVDIIVSVTGSMPYVRLDRIRGNRRPGFCIVLNRKDQIVSFLSAIRPYLTGKAAEADVLLYAIQHKGFRQPAIGMLRDLKVPSYANAEVTLQGLRSGAHRNDYGVSPNNNPRTSAHHPVILGDDIV